MCTFTEFLASLPENEEQSESNYHRVQLPGDVKHFRAIVKISMMDRREGVVLLTHQEMYILLPKNAINTFAASAGVLFGLAGGILGTLLGSRRDPSGLDLILPVPESIRAHPGVPKNAELRCYSVTKQKAVDVRYPFGSSLRVRTEKGTLKLIPIPGRRRTRGLLYDLNWLK